MKIEISRGKTRIFLRKKEEGFLRNLLDSIESFKNLPFNWSGAGYYYINSAISEEDKKRILERAKGIEDNGFITGFSGCPVIGTDFRWRN